MDLDGLTAEVEEILADVEEPPATPHLRVAERRPVHCWYVVAGDFHADHVRDAGREAEGLILEHAEEFLDCLDGDDALMARVLDKLAAEPVEDLRLDFTPWTGDRVVDRAAVSWSSAAASGDLPDHVGIRIPALGRDTRVRAVRTLGRFLEGIGEVPDDFVVTVRTVTGVAQVEALVHLAERIEKELTGSLRFEVQLESPRAVVSPDGVLEIARMLDEAGDRIAAVQLVPDGFGSDRLLEHALTQVQVAAHGRDLRLVDGATVRIGRGDTVVDVWTRHLAQVRRSLERGVTQGRDAHPVALPTRYAATYHFAATST